MENRVKIGILAIFITFFFGIFGVSINNPLLVIGGGVPCIASILICLYLDLHNNKVSKWFDKTKLGRNDTRINNNTSYKRRT